MNLTIMKYGPPPDLQPMYGVPYYPEPQPEYGMPVYTPRSPLVALFTAITTPVFVIASFLVGSVLYLLTHKKVFIVIPFILSILYLARYIAETFFGISFASFY